MNVEGSCSPALDSVCPERAGFDSDTLRRAGNEPHVLTVSSRHNCDAGTRTSSASLVLDRSTTMTFIAERGSHRVSSIRWPPRLVLFLGSARRFDGMEPQ